MGGATLLLLFYATQGSTPPSDALRYPDPSRCRIRVLPDKPDSSRIKQL